LSADIAQLTTRAMIAGCITAADRKKGLIEQLEARSNLMIFFHAKQDFLLDMFLPVFRPSTMIDPMDRIDR
jgi:hypothetical protein